VTTTEQLRWHANWLLTEADRVADGLEKGHILNRAILLAQEAQALERWAKVKSNTETD
jgi:hypothetical protein